MSFDRRSDEVKIHGQHACRALFERRPDDVLRVYLAEDQVRPFGDLLHVCAETHRPYRIVTPAELERLTDSKHHEGICVVARPRAQAPLDELLRTPGPGWLVAAAEVGNPHNVGAILRIAAHFGARGALLAGAAERLPAAAHRTAQGGAEWLDVFFCGPTPSDLLRLFETCRAHGFRILATSSHGGRSLHDGPLPERAVVLLGAEGEGLPPALMQAADEVLYIPGSGRIESLNVASAASVLLAEVWRQHGPRTAEAPAAHRPAPSARRTRPAAAAGADERRADQPPQRAGAEGRKKRGAATGPHDRGRRDEGERASRFEPPRQGREEPGPRGPSASEARLPRDGAGRAADSWQRPRMGGQPQRSYSDRGSNQQTRGEASRDRKPAREPDREGRAGARTPRSRPRDFGGSQPAVARPPRRPRSR